MTPRNGRRAVRATAGATAFAGLFALSLLPRCYGQSCDPTRVDYGLSDGEGELVDADTWESQPITARWLDFPGQRTLVVHLDHKLGGRPLTEVYAWLSASPEPNNAAIKNPNFALASGNLAEFHVVDDDTIEVHNDTCADYYVRVLLRSGAPTSLDVDGGDAGNAPARASIVSQHLIWSTP
jgi:hypothetical protein